MGLYRLIRDVHQVDHRAEDVVEVGLMGPQAPLDMREYPFRLLGDICPWYGCPASHTMFPTRAFAQRGSVCRTETIAVSGGMDLCTSKASRRGF